MFAAEVLGSTTSTINLVCVRVCVRVCALLPPFPSWRSVKVPRNRLNSFHTMCRIRGYWTMEDWLAFVETFSPWLFYKLPWKKEDEETKISFEEQWKVLRQAILYAIRYAPGQHLSARITQCRQDFLEYGRLIQKVSACQPRHVLLRNHAWCMM
jgi:hypothetical protein